MNAVIRKLCPSCNKDTYNSLKWSGCYNCRNKIMVKMWLDDVRKAPPDFVWVKSYHEAVLLLETGTVSYASLDHDLTLDYEIEDINPFAKTGYDVITWMETNEVWPVNGVVCHSMNPSGRKRIEQVIQKMEQKYGKA